MGRTPLTRSGVMNRGTKDYAIFRLGRYPELQEASRDEIGHPAAVEECPALKLHFWCYVVREGPADPVKQF
jgi:hypothetical protein